SSDVCSSDLPGVARIVHDDVEALEGVDRGLHETLSEIGRRDVSAARHRVAAGGTDLLDHRMRGLGVEIVDDDPCAFGGQLQRDGTADATPGSRYECDPAFELSHVRSVRCDSTRLSRSVASAVPCWRSTARWTFPVAVFGSSCTSRT